MTIATYATIPDLIATLTPFKHGSCHALWETSEIRGVRTFKVYSYSTLIATLKTDENGVEIERGFNPQKYSMTTSRLQNIIRKAWGF